MSNFGPGMPPPIGSIELYTPDGGRVIAYQLRLGAGLVVTPLSPVGAIIQAVPGGGSVPASALAPGAPDTAFVTNHAGTAVVTALVVDNNVDPNAQIQCSKLGLNTQLYGGQQYVSTVDAKGQEVDTKPQHVTTLDATVTTVASFDLSGLTTGTFVMNVMVSAIQSDGSAGAGFVLTATARRSGGVLTQVATTNKLAQKDNAAWDATIDVSGNLMRVRVTGVNATTITWTSIYTGLQVVP